MTEAFINRIATAHPLIAASQHFCVNILALDQRRLAERFAGGEPRSRFEGVAYHIGAGGSPILEGTVAHVDCRVTEELTASTHTIFLGEVLEAGSRDAPPLATNASNEKPPFRAVIFLGFGAISLRSMFGSIHLRISKGAVTSSRSTSS